MNYNSRKARNRQSIHTGKQRTAVAAGGKNEPQTIHRVLMMTAMNKIVDGVPPKASTIIS